MDELSDAPESIKNFSAAEMGAIAHLYRAEIYRSTVWRTRLDTTTNWAVVTLGIALSIAFHSPDASPMPLMLVGILIIFFLLLEARRYRYFNVWRARTRWMELHIYAPMLVGQDLHLEQNWQMVLARDYQHPHYHISLMRAIARRIRSNYLWILIVQTIAYVGKLVVHPFPATSLEMFFKRGEIGPIPGQVSVALGLVYISIWAGIAIWGKLSDRSRIRVRGTDFGLSMG